ncbi:TPA: hypothetical protein DEO28_02510 [Candidatus Dependentiae bacterium]|nr:MAG: Nucleotidyltransferase substrate binding protein, HI0074 family [candidate division TM6 bacterium GW2011_GWE2_31_21]KKP53266.1 MAG: Nucleotidyltransferase substrate binding protein, HI0074 family [candidate division TM6 bacterium GW2011_GWF2_33_332]HBS48035.1 hypothetical protein [Candidatus Dependentiae bacterium]HBZ73362.1 hypothetical protein [Candidatus Dependentiae bacterium]
MDELKIKYKNLESALKSLGKAFNNLEKLESKKDSPSLFLEYNELYKSLRDSLIQRFEFSVDLFWKYLKKYLEKRGVPTLEVSSPKPTLKSACKATLLTEQDTDVALKMIDSRNLTSHMYKEEFAEMLLHQIPSYYQIMKKYSEKLYPDK